MCNRVKKPDYGKTRQFEAAIRISNRYLNESRKDSFLKICVVEESTQFVAFIFVMEIFLHFIYNNVLLTCTKF